MHDIDRTQLEFSSELPGFESGSFNNESFEFDNEEGVLSEADEAELADELLGVSNEEELDQFLGSLIRKVAKGAGKVLSSPVGQAVGGVLKGVAKKALPLAGGALGGWVGGPLGAKPPPRPYGHRGQGARPSRPSPWVSSSRSQPPCRWTRRL